MSRVLISITLLLSLANLSLACSCLFQSFEDRFCEADLSIRGRVLHAYDNCAGTCDPIADQFGGRIFYIVRVVEHFKGPEIEDDLLYLSTAVNGGLCGTRLEVGRYYLLNLRVPPVAQESCPSPLFPVSLCDSPTMFSTLSEEQKGFVRAGEEVSCPPLLSSVGGDSLSLDGAAVDVATEKVAE